MRTLILVQSINCYLGTAISDLIVFLEPEKHCSTTIRVGEVLQLGPHLVT
jgi:hypothetical protein